MKSEVALPVGRSILIYACAFAVVGMTPFLLLPILTKYLTPQQFGEVTSFLVLTALLANIAGLTAHGYVSVRFFKTAAEQFRILVASSIAAVMVMHMLALLVVALLFPILARALDLSLGYMLMAVLAALFLNLNLVFLAIFQSSGKPWLYLRSRALQGVTELALCIALLFLVTTDASARIYSYTLALAASAMLGLWYCARRGQLGAHLEAAPVSGLLRFGVPMLPHIAAGTAITYLDRLVVSSLLGAESLGIYMVAMQVGMAMIALIEPLNKALAPWLFKQMTKGHDEVRRMIVKRTYQLFVMLTLVGALIALAAHLLFDQLIGTQFSGARPLIPWMIAGFVMQGMYYTVVNYMFYAERTGTLSMVTGSIAVLGCLVSYGLTSAFGLQGAGASFLINNSLLFLLVWFAASRAVPMPWRLGR